MSIPQASFKLYFASLERWKVDKCNGKHHGGLRLYYF